MPFGTEKLEWCVYPMVKHTHRQTEGHRMTAQAALMHSIAWQKSSSNSYHLNNMKVGLFWFYLYSVQSKYCSRPNSLVRVRQNSVGWPNTNSHPSNVWYFSRQTYWSTRLDVLSVTALWRTFALRNNKRSTWSLVMCDLMNISYSCRLVVIKHTGQRLLWLSFPL